MTAVVLFAMSAVGIPASTTHAKTCAVIGSGLQADGKFRGGKTVLSMAAAWALTFPVCAALGYVLAGALRSFYR